MKRILVEIFISFIIIFFIAQCLRYFVYEPLQSIVQSRVFLNEDPYSDIVLGKSGGLGFNNLPLPGSVAFLGFLISLLMVFLVCVYDLLALDDGGFKRSYLLIFFVCILIWFFLFPEVLVEPFFGQINNTLVNLIKIPIF